MRRLACVVFALLPAAAAAQDLPPFATFDAASAAVLHDPHDLAFGPDGMLYVADKFDGTVAVMDPDTLAVTRRIGAGALPGVHDVSFDAQGRMHVAVTGLGAVVTFELDGGVAREVAVLAPFPRTEGVLAHSNGRLYVTAAATGGLFAIEDGEIVAEAGGMSGVHDVAEAPDGTLWVADTFRRRLVQFTPELDLLRTLEGPRYGFAGPRYMDFDEDGFLVVADQDAHRVLKIDPVSGDVLGAIGTGEPGEGPNLLDDPEGVAVRGSRYFFADSDNDRIVRYVVVIN